MTLGLTRYMLAKRLGVDRHVVLRYHHQKHFTLVKVNKKQIVLWEDIHRLETIRDAWPTYRALAERYVVTYETMRSYIHRWGLQHLRVKLGSTAHFNPEIIDILNQKFDRPPLPTPEQKRQFHNRNAKRYYYKNREMILARKRGDCCDHVCTGRPTNRNRRGRKTLTPVLPEGLQLES